MTSLSPDSKAPTCPTLQKKASQWLSPSNKYIFKNEESSSCHWTPRTESDNNYIHLALCTRTAGRHRLVRGGWPCGLRHWWRLMFAWKTCMSQRTAFCDLLSKHNIYLSYRAAQYTKGASWAPSQHQFQLSSDYIPSIGERTITGRPSGLSNFLTSESTHAPCCLTWKHELLQ